VLEFEILVSEFLSVDGLAAGAVASGKVTSLKPQASTESRTESVTWHIKSGMTLWKVDPLKCKGLPDLPVPFSPAHPQLPQSVIPFTCAQSAEILCRFRDDIGKELTHHWLEAAKEIRAKPYFHNDAAQWLPACRHIEKYSRICH